MNIDQPASQQVISHVNSPRPVNLTTVRFDVNAPPMTLNSLNSRMPVVPRSRLVTVSPRASSRGLNLRPAIPHRSLDSTVDRSAQNITTWSSYLPADCIQLMILHGWDHST
jgi:hypothetical protein